MHRIFKRAILKIEHVGSNFDSKSTQNESFSDTVQCGVHTITTNSLSLFRFQWKITWQKEKMRPFPFQGKLQFVAAPIRSANSFAHSNRVSLLHRSPTCLKCQSRFWSSRKSFFLFLLPFPLTYFSRWRLDSSLQSCSETPHHVIHFHFSGGKDARLRGIHLCYALGALPRPLDLQQFYHDE